eukprot:scaffold2557_cov363-Pavlova_lutheri.AAC.2
MGGCYGSMAREVLLLVIIILEILPGESSLLKLHASKVLVQYLDSQQQNQDLFEYPLHSSEVDQF